MYKRSFSYYSMLHVSNAFMQLVLGTKYPEHIENKQDQVE